MYNWVVLLHVLSALGFMLAHGASAAVMFQVRAEREPARLRALLDLTEGTGRWMAITLLLVVVFGIVAGFMGGWWRFGWIWVSLALLVALNFQMTFMGRFYFDRVRRALGIASPADVKAKVQPPALPPDELAAVIAAGRPGLVAALGLAGLAVITWLMILKPF